MFWRKFALGILVTLFIGFLGVPVVADEPASKSNEIFVIEVNGEPVEVSADDAGAIRKLKRRAAAAMRRASTASERARDEIFVIDVNGEPVEVSADDEEEIRKLKKAAASTQRVFAGRERARERLEHDPELLQKHFHLHDTQDYSDSYCELEADTYVLAGGSPPRAEWYGDTYNWWWGGDPPTAECITLRERFHCKVSTSWTLPDEPGWSIESGDAIYLKRVHDDWICHHEDWHDLILSDLVGGHTYAEQEDATDFRFEGEDFVFLGDKDRSFIF